MFMRFVQLKLKPDSIDAYREFYEKVVTPELRKTYGCLFAGLIKSEPEINEFASLTIWQAQEHAEKYETVGSYKSLIDQSKPFLSESTEWRVQLSDNFELEYGPVEEEPVIKKYAVAVQNENEEKLFVDTKNMYLRILSIKIEENKMEEFKNLYSEEVLPALKNTAGCRYVFLIESVNEKEEFISVTIWNSKEDADAYESSGAFLELTKRVRHTFSQLYLWKMAFEKKPGVKVHTSEDFRVEHYDIVTGKSF